MRTNLPVTQNAYDFSSSETLLSTTDTNSRITYANAAFVRISGFELDELREARLAPIVNFKGRGKTGDESEDAQ